MKKSKKILLKWAATYGEDESDVKASMYNEDMMIEFAKYYHKQKLTLTDVVSSFNLEIKDKDIATIEALHDTLLDKKVLGLNARSMKESRALTQRMYKAISKD